MADPTFRDFATAAMSGNTEEAARVLGILLALDAPAATAAASHFQSEAKADPAFVMKAMGLRTAVTAPDAAETRALLAACFGLADPQLDASVTAVRARYGAP
jgi:hypothetical protein